jgi:amino acid transporter
MFIDAMTCADRPRQLGNYHSSGSCGHLYRYQLLGYVFRARARIVADVQDATTHPAVYMTVFLVLILAVNFLGTRVFGEMEFWFSSLKVIAIVGLIILGIILMAGGGPNHDPIGFRYWRNPGEHSLVLGAVEAEWSLTS